MILLAITILQVACGWLVLGRRHGCSHNNDRATQIAAELSIIIPARNEENNLPRLLSSLVDQSIAPESIIVVDDGSTDRTAEVARQHGVRVLPAPPLPDGWRGKTWACQQGSQVASGRFLLFLDADTWFEPGGLVSALSEFPVQQRGAVSIVPHHCVRAFHEQFSAFFNLLMLAGSGALTVLPERFVQPRLLGQFLLIDRTSYEAVGRHETVKGRILENFWLAKQLHAAKVPLRCRSGRGVFSFRMYPDGWRQMMEGWTKGFAAGAGQTPLPILLLTILWLGGIFFVPLAIFTQPGPVAWLVLYALCVAQVSWFLRRAGTFHWLTGVLYPVFVLFFFAVFGRAVLRRGKTVSWKGRQVQDV